MISPADIRTRAERWWADGSLLRAIMAGESFCPQSLSRIKAENPATVMAEYGRVQTEQQALRAGSCAELGYGYTLSYTTSKTRRSASVTLITGISFETDAHLLRYLNRQADAELFRHLLTQTRQEVPELAGWIAKHPLRLLEHATDWPDLLLICRYFRDEYQPDCQYVRQLPLPVHTKFLEERSTLLLSLLAFVTPALLRPDHRDWRKKLGLLVPEPMIRIRVSPDSALTGLLPVAEKQTDFGLPLSAFARHVQPVRRVFICENLLNFLTLPVLPDTAAIWSGGGFNIECLAGVDWLREKPILYWGDLDAHGFQILNQCRGYFPSTQAILMDRPTFDAHRHLISAGEPTPVASLPHLTAEETELFQLLKRNTWRIEQERLSGTWVAEVLGGL